MWGKGARKHLKLDDAVLVFVRLVDEHPHLVVRHAQLHLVQQLLWVRERGGGGVLSKRLTNSQTNQAFLEKCNMYVFLESDK